MLKHQLRQLGLGICALGSVLSFFGLPSQAAPTKPKFEACPFPNSSQFVHSSTRRFDVYICGGDTPHQYVGVAKDGSGSIRLPLEKSQGFPFVAVQGNFKYILTRDRLFVVRNGRVILQESATRHEFD